MRPLSLVFLAACAGGAKTLPAPTGSATDPTDVHPTTDTPTGVTSPTGPCPALGDVTTALGVQPLEQRFEVDLDGAAAVWATCTSPDDPDELHLVESTTPATHHELVLRGVLGQTDYQCEVHAACGGPSKEVAFTSGTPSGIPVLTASRDPSREMSGAYTLFNSQPGCGGAEEWLIIADPEEKVRWAYPIGEDLLTDVDAYLMDANTIHLGGGWGLFDAGAPNRGVFRTMDLSGKVSIERTAPDFGLGFNHASEPLADGTYLSIVGDVDTQGTRDWNGVGIEVWSPTDGLVWTWDSQGLVDSGFIQPPATWNETEPYHANAASIHTDALGEALWVSDYGMEQIWRIDRNTSEMTHMFGVGGDFDLVDAQGDPLPDSEFPQVQHGVDYQDDRVLLYDNGQQRGYTRVAEYRLDLASDVATLLWTWTEPKWYDPILGDADYLPNGNVLVAQGYNQCLTPFGGDVSEIVELTPPDEVVWRLTFPGSTYSMYRAERYDGCAVFGNARYCSAVSDRIAELEAAAARLIRVRRRR